MEKRHKTNATNIKKKRMARKHTRTIRGVTNFNYVVLVLPPANNGENA